jgi:hypothetical protein
VLDKLRRELSSHASKDDDERRCAAARGAPSVHFGYIPDVPLALTNVCFEGKIGPGGGVTGTPSLSI